MTHCDTLGFADVSMMRKSILLSEVLYRPESWFISTERNLQSSEYRGVITLGKVSTILWIIFNSGEDSEHYEEL